MFSPFTLIKSRSASLANRCLILSFVFIEAHIKDALYLLSHSPNSKPKHSLLASCGLDQHSSCLCVEVMCLGLREEAALQTVKILPNRTLKTGLQVTFGNRDSQRIQTVNTRRGLNHEVSWGMLLLHQLMFKLWNT